MNVNNYVYNGNDFDMNYRVFYPDNYEELPLLVFLHGAGECGSNIENIYRHAVPKLIGEGREINAVEMLSLSL